MKDTKLNNLLDMENFSVEKVTKKAKATKRTEVAKDVLQENAYVVGKDVLKEKPNKKEDHTTSKGLNNLISLDDFTKEAPKTSAKSTKHTSVAKDILEKKKVEEAEKCEKCGKEPCECKDEKKK